MAKERLSKLQEETLLFLADKRNLNAQQGFRWRGKKMDCVEYNTLLEGLAEKLNRFWSFPDNPYKHFPTSSFEVSFSRSLKNLYLKGLIDKEEKRIMYGKYGTSNVWLTKVGKVKIKEIS